MVAVAKECAFDGPGSTVTLLDLFDGLRLMTSGRPSLPGWR